MVEMRLTSINFSDFFNQRLFGESKVLTYIWMKRKPCESEDENQKL
jgi:hypothetical protein